MKRHQTQITVWPAITDLMISIVVIAVLVGIVGYIHFNNSTTRILIAQEKTRKHILRELKEGLKEHGITVETLPEQGVLRLSEDAVNFPLGGIKPREGHQENIGWLAQVLAEIVPCYVFSDRDTTIAAASIARIQSGTDKRRVFCQPVAPLQQTSCEEMEYDVWLLETILIEGHTDSLPVGEGNRFRNNLELSSMRAASVYDMITDCEPRIKDMYNSGGTPVLSTSGYGYMRPAHFNPRDRRNRRVDIRLLLEPPRSRYAKGEKSS